MLNINLLISALFGAILTISLLNYGQAFNANDSELYAFIMQCFFGSVGSLAGIGVFLIFIKNYWPKDLNKQHTH